MSYNRSLLAAAVFILVVSAALGGDATRVLTSTYETGENMGRNLESQATPDSYPLADGPVEFMISGADW
ncbi:hypothetical protein ACJRO7_022034 [Eucalyptus globulus]|uniref:Uncharacterized protein n=1 Tax=Eucalyptus globulus TaxID=34317 RepID=A0ABD3KM36_EUCGL